MLFGTYAAEVWQLSQANAIWLSAHDTKVLDWFSQATTNMDQRCFEAGLVIMWTIWNSRNAEVKNREKGKAHITAAA